MTVWQEKILQIIIIGEIFLIMLNKIDLGIICISSSIKLHT